MAQSTSDFLTLLQQTVSPTYSQYQAAADAVIEDPSLTKINEKALKDLFLDLGSVGPRLRSVLDILNLRRPSKKVADAIAYNLLLPLLLASQELDHQDEVTRIITSGITVILNCANTALEALAEALSESNGILERLVTDEKGGRALDRWVEDYEHSLQNPSVLQIFTQRLLDLCNSCTHDHGTSNLFDQWLDLSTLKNSLELVERDTQISQTQLSHTAQCIPLQNLKRLEEYDKKMGRSQQQLPAFDLPASILEGLAKFQLDTPKSLRTLDSVLESLKVRETLKVMRSAMKTFPCRPCNQATRKAGNPGDFFRTDTRRLETVDSAFNLEIFGQRIGVWKVLLSAQALRDFRNLSHSGQFDTLNKKFMELASGGWKGRNLSTRVGSQSQKTRMRVPILGARCPGRLWILWQIDVGIYDELASVRQLVKVWQIIHIDKFNSAVNGIIDLQKLYGPELCRQCQKAPLSQPDGTLVPLEFSPAEDHFPLVISSMTDNIREDDKRLIEMSNKFYSVTEPLLRSLLSGDQSSEFPFELSQEELHIVSHFSSSTLILGRSGTGKTTCLIFKILTRFRVSNALPGESVIRQILLTKSSYLASKLNSYTRNLFESQMANELTLELPSEVDTLPDAEDDLQVTDSIFSFTNAPLPLVCTFDRFLSLMENTIKIADRKDFDGSGGAVRRKPRVLDFHVFRTEYWVRFPPALIKHLSVELVFAEIMGVIKGSISSVDTLAAISREEYSRASSRLAPTFATDQERRQLYDTYEQYERLKLESGDIDQIDRVRSLLEVIQSTPDLSTRLGEAFDNVYIDEVQDLRCLDVALLLTVVNDARGIHLAGDTAQCISMDSTFRFAEIKNLLYQRYATVSQSSKQEELARPTQFSLAKNYRSHQGILNLASLVMKLLWTGFPDTVDKLVPEIGMLEGPKPLFFAGFDADVLSSRMIGLVNLNDNLSDFGAEQVILVRDDEAKANLKSKIGDVALTLTILESKGMEFNDVLLYNFFSDSEQGPSYRSLYMLLGADRKNFDAIKHAILCSELKHLYVAVTRARQQLWFLEGSKESVNPILKVLGHGGTNSLIDVVKPKDADVAAKLKILRAGGSIDPKRWAERGYQFLKQKNFEDAQLCFTKSGDSRGITTASAYLKDKEARISKAQDDHEGFVKGSEAAIELFLQAGLINNASKCMENMGDFIKAATLWYERGEFEKAAELFQKGELFEKASMCYHLNGSYDKAAAALRFGDLYDHLIVYVNDNRRYIDPESCRNYGRLCNLLLKQGRVSPDLRSLSIGLLGSNDVKEQFFKEFEMTTQLADFYRTQGRNESLFHLLIEDGQLTAALEAVDLDNPVWSFYKDQIEMVFNFLQVARIFGGDYDESNIIFVPSHWQEGPPFYLSAATAKWRLATQVFNLAKTGQMAKNLGDLDRMAKECLCLSVVIFLPDYIGRTTKVSDLPVEILNETSAVIQGLLSEKTESFSESLRLVCGFFRTPSQKEICLSWSPFFQIEANENKGDISVLRHEMAISWIKDKFSTAIVAFDEKARDLWAKDWPEPCRHFLSNRKCYKALKNECMYLHNNTVEEYTSMVLALLRVSTVFPAILRIHTIRGLSEQFQQSYFPRPATEFSGRKWLEKLLRTLTYISAKYQASSAVIAATSALHSDQAYFKLASSLEDHLFYRFSREWEKRSSIAALMAQCQLARILGCGVHDRFSIAVMRKIGYERRNCFDQNHQLRQTGQVAHNFLRLQAAVFSGSEVNTEFFQNELRNLLITLDTIDEIAFTECYAIVSLYEFIGTYLLFARRSGQSIVIPHAWAGLYLAPIIASQPKQEYRPEAERMKYTECIRMLIDSFSHFLGRLERVLSLGFTFSSGPSIITQRRNMEFLAIFILNLGSEWNPTRGYREMCDQIQNVFLLPSSPLQFLRPAKFPDFVQRLMQSYNIYNGKDRLMIVDFEEKQKNSPTTEQLIKLGVVRSSLAEVLADNDTSSNTWKMQSTNDSDEPTEHLTQAVVKIQAFWRRCAPKLQEARAFRQRPNGRLITDYLDLVAPLNLSASIKIVLRALFLTEGVELQLHLGRIAEEHRARRHALSGLLTDSTTPATQLEELQGPWTEFLGQEAGIIDMRTRWAVATLRTRAWWLDPGKLEEKLERDLGVVGEMWGVIRGWKG